MQLIAYGAHDIFLSSPTISCQCCNSNEIIKQPCRESIYYKITNKLEIVNSMNEDGMGYYCSIECAQNKINNIKQILENYDNKPCDICNGVCQNERYCIKNTFIGKKVWMPLSKEDIIEHEYSDCKAYFGNYCSIECAKKSYEQ